MRTLEEIQERLRNLKGSGYTQETLGKRAGMAQSKISEIANNRGRVLSYSDGLILNRLLWPDDPQGKSESALRVQFNAEISIALTELLNIANVGFEKADLVVSLLPAIVEEVQSAAAEGVDPRAAARTAARLLWPQGRAPRRG